MNKKRSMKLTVCAVWSTVNGGLSGLCNVCTENVVSSCRSQFFTQIFVVLCLAFYRWRQNRRTDFMKKYENSSTRFSASSNVVCADVSQWLLGSNVCFGSFSRKQHVCVCIHGVGLVRCKTPRETRKGIHAEQPTNYCWSYHELWVVVVVDL